MVVFSSMRGDEINAAATASRGAQLLRDFLLYAERGRLEGAAAAGADADAEPAFEREVLAELRARGLAVVPRVGAAGYRIDLGVLDDAAPGRFLCGIECDGAAYHRSESARDRDRLRQQVLEARGWTIHRVWSTDWFKDREGQIERLLALVAADRAHAAEARAADQAAHARMQAELAAAAAADGERRRQEAAALLAAAAAPYVRPAAAPYAVAPGEDRHAGAELLAAPAGQLLAAVRDVVAAEAPVHEADVVSRVAGMWGTRAGARIQARIVEAARGAARDGVVRRRGDVYWGGSDEVRPRSRAGLRVPAERIAPEEYQAAVRLVLAQGHGFPRGQLTTEVRAVLGFARTGAALDEAITAAVDAMLAAGELGEGSVGLRLRAAARPA
jgi:hypothetical protein